MRRAVCPPFVSTAYWRRDLGESLQESHRESPNEALAQGIRAYAIELQCVITSIAPFFSLTEEAKAPVGEEEEEEEEEEVVAEEEDQRTSGGGGVKEAKD